MSDPLAAGKADAVADHVRRLEIAVFERLAEIERMIAAIETRLTRLEEEVER